MAARVLPLAAKIGAAMKEALGCAGFNLVQNNRSGSGTDGLSFPCTRDPPLRRRTGNGDWEPGKMASEELAETAARIEAAL